MYRLVQECKCGCGKRRAIKSKEPIIFPEDYHHAVISKVHGLADFPTNVLGALEDVEVLARVRGIAGELLDEELNALDGRFEAIEGRLKALEDYNKRSFWKKLFGP